MADVCIVYGRPSERVVKPLRDFLATHYDVWWDAEISSGDYRTAIEAELEKAGCVIPVWCSSSRVSRYVTDEADFAQKRGKTLLPVRLEEVEPPLGFMSLHTVDLFGWSGDENHPGLQELLRNIERSLLPQPLPIRRMETLDVRGKPISLPAFFWSVSSHETQLRPEAAVKALRLFNAPTVLVSAYDMVREPSSVVDQIVADLEMCRSAGSCVLLDSGNYEAYRKCDERWSPDDLREAIVRTPHDFAFCFDDLDPPNSVDDIVCNVQTAVERDSRPMFPRVLPIVHAPRSKGVIRTELVPEIMKQVSDHLQPASIAVPERELGDGLIARARMVYKIRRSLDELGFYQPLHLLGTGNPLSIAIFAAAGADTFDGLEWCRTVAEEGTGRLYHFQQFEFFELQAQMASTAIVREAVVSRSIEFSGKVTFHNLETFSTWMQELGGMLRSGRVDRFLSEKLPNGGMRVLEKAVPEVFG